MTTWPFVLGKHMEASILDKEKRGMYI
uniref:Uncharacterized protein n=1 Tax=Anguilla anguilla TaxID=7936 RepID=A0A0E9RT49_ANGAN